MASSATTTTPPPPQPGGARKQSMVAGRKEIGDFWIGKLLGEGAFARVYAVRMKESAADYAMKVMEKKFIVKQERLYMIMDLCQGGELARLIRFQRDKVAPVRRALSEADARFYLTETVSAIQYLHTLGIVHRDVKPENILITKDGHVKLTDFGTCKDNVVATTTTTTATTTDNDNPAPKRKDTFCGTAEYVSPEVLQDSVTGFSSDLWALGIMTFFMLTGRTPFLADSEFLTFQHILAYAGQTEAIQSLQELDHPQPFITGPEALVFPDTAAADYDELSPHAIDLVRKLLDPVPAHRIGATNPNELKSHAFFVGIDFTALDKLTPPPLPYAMFSDTPMFDGSKNDWLLSDDGGEDLLEEFTATPRKSTESSPRVAKSSSENRASTGGSYSVPGTPPVNGYTSLLKPSEHVVVEGPVTVSAQMGLVTRRRHLLLCQNESDGLARFLYIDPVSVTQKGEIPVIRGQITVSIRPSGKDFDIVTGKKTFRFKDVMGAPDRWKFALDKVLEGA